MPREKCPKCDGKGKIPAGETECPRCGGTGFVGDVDISEHFKGAAQHAVEGYDLASSRDVPCPKCQGKGVITVYEECDRCGGTGYIVKCRECGKELDPDVEEDLCEECRKKIKQIRKEKLPKVKVLSPACGYEDVEEGELYKGKVSRVEKYGVFIELNDRTLGLLHRRDMGDKEPQDFSIGDEVVVKVTDVRPEDGEIDFTIEGIDPRPDRYREEVVEKELKRVLVRDIDESKIGETVLIKGKIIHVQQTPGPTVFTLRDESGSIWMAAFEGPGIRAYPDIEAGDYVRVIGEVTTHDGQLQVEILDMEKLVGTEKVKIKRAIDEALDREAEPPEDLEPMVDSEIIRRLWPRMREVAKEIKRAVLEGRPVLIRHHADADGISGGVALEEAILPILKENNPDPEAEYHFYKRFPNKAPIYTLEDASRDLNHALEDVHRYGHQVPLLVLLDIGCTEEDVPAIEEMKAYGVDVLVIDHHYPGEAVGENPEDGLKEFPIDEHVKVHVNPYAAGGDGKNIPAGVLAVEIARLINPEVEDRIKHLPAVACLGDHAESPEAEQYLEIAEEAGFDRRWLRKIADSVDFQAFQLRHTPGRHLMNDVLGTTGDEHRHRRLVENLYEQHKIACERQLEAALEGVKEYEANGVKVVTLDVERYARKFEYPGPGKTCGLVHDLKVEEEGDDAKVVTIAYGPDFAVIRATENLGINLNDIVSELEEEMPEAAVEGGGHETAGSISFVEAHRNKVLKALVEKILRDATS
ncbi:OB-fold nucleic acid binding domain-containing protein [Methanopyrus kandleri]